MKQGTATGPHGRTAGGPPVWIAPAVLFAVGVNALLFLLLPVLTNTRPPVADMSDPVSVNLVRIRPEEPPPPEEKEIPEVQIEEKQSARTDFAPDVFRPRIRQMDMPQITFDAMPPLAAGPSDFGFANFFNAEDLDHPPRATFKAPPLYPYRAKRLEVQGHVRVKFLVDETGAVDRVTILEAKPPGMFEDSVKATLQRWKFTPGKILGEPVASWVTTTIRFELE